MDFPDGPVVMSLCFHCRGKGLVPGGGSKIPHATWHGLKQTTIKQKRSREIKDRQQLLEVWLLREARGETMEWAMVPRKGKGTNWKKGRRQ